MLVNFWSVQQVLGFRYPLQAPHTGIENMTNVTLATFAAATNFSNSTTNEDNQHHPRWLQILRVVIMCLLMAMTIFGNTLILLGVRKIEELKSVTGTFLANLALSDLGVGLICLPIAVAAAIDEALLQNTAACSLDGFSLVLFFISSILTMCVISIHKYIAVVFAMQNIFTKKRAIILLGFVWFISIALAAGPLLGWSKYVYKAGRHQCTTPAPENTATLVHMIMLLSFGYIIPLITMLFCYSRLFCTARKHLRRLQANAITDCSGTTSESDLVNTLVIILLAFVVCWLPFVVYITYGITKRPIPFYLPTIAFLFGYGNSALNPVIYALRHRSFRTGFWDIMCLRFKAEKRKGNSTLLSTTDKQSPNLALENATRQQGLNLQKDTQATKGNGEMIELNCNFPLEQGTVHLKNRHGEGDSV